MYINFQQLARCNITQNELLLLVKISQKDSQFITAEDKDGVDKLLKEELVELTKQGKTIRERLRVSKKGKQFLRNVETANYTDEIQYLEEKLVKLYEGYDKDIGLRADVKNRLTWFVSETGFRIDIIEKYVDLYLQETEHKYIKTLANLIWTPQSIAFSVKFNLKDSKLFDIICKNMNLQQSVFLDKRDKELEYLFQYGTVKPPKGLDEDLYYTGSYKGDEEHFLKLASKLNKRIIK